MTKTEGTATLPADLRNNLPGRIALSRLSTQEVTLMPNDDHSHQVRPLADPGAR